MQARNLLMLATAAASLTGAPACKRTRLNTDKNEPVVAARGQLTPAQKTERLGRRIPLDSIGSPSPWLIAEAGHDSPGVTLTGQYGLEKQYAVFPDEEELTLTAPAAKGEQFPGYAVVSERSLWNVSERPQARIFNLSDLLERLGLESRWEGGRPSGKSRLPEGVAVFPTSEVDLTVTITRPTVLAASFSTNRNLRILNRSRLVLVVPLLQNVTIQQSRAAEVGSEMPRTEIHSFSCVQLDRFAFEGTVKHYLLDSSLIGDPTNCDTGTSDPSQGIETPTPSKLALEAWAPQVLITQRLRKESISATYARFAPLFPIAALAMGGR